MAVCKILLAHTAIRGARALLGLALAGLLVGAAACERGPEVVVYVALDNVFSREVLDDFTRATGVRVRPVFDTEATKTTGLVERLRRERQRPRCDVFWNNELLRTIALAEEGLLEPYDSPSATGIPQRFRDPQRRWTGFAARARALAFDPKVVQPSDAPRSHEALLEARWRGRVALADPRFGTTGSHLAMLLEAWGEPRLRTWLRGLRANEVQIVASNAATRDRALSGAALLGLTDTDDVEVVRRQGGSIDETLLENDGVVLIPNSVALVQGAPHPETGRRLIDYLLSEAVEARLAASPSRQIPVRPDVPIPDRGLRLADLSILEVDYARASARLGEALTLAAEELGR